MTQENYDSVFGSPGGSLISFHEIKTIMDVLGHPSGRRILDVGTGTGRVAIHFAKLGNSVIGIDIDVPRMATASSKSKNHDGYDVMMADGEHIPIQRSAFDLVICVRVLKYFRRPVESLKEIARVLKPGGMCVIEFSNSLGYERLFMALRKLVSRKRYAPEMGQQYNLLNPFEMMGNLRMLGLRIFRIVGWHKIPPALFGKIRRKGLLKALYLVELALEALLPSVCFSRGVLIACAKRS